MLKALCNVKRQYKVVQVDLMEYFSFFNIDVTFQRSLLHKKWKLNKEMCPVEIKCIFN